jgi:hypothetical protein
MSESSLAEQLTEAAHRLLGAAHGGVVDGDAVARAIGRDPADPAVYQAFQQIQARGTLTLKAWGTGHGLPHEVGGPRMN